MVDPVPSRRRVPSRRWSPRISWVGRVIATAAMTLVLVASAAGAHSGIQSYVYVSLSDSEVDGRVEYPVADLGEVLGIEFPTDLDGIRAVATANAGVIRQYTADHFAMGDADGPWELSFTEDLAAIGAQGGYVLVPYSVERSFDAAPRSFRVDYDGILHANPERDALLIIENDWGTANLNNEGDFLVGFSVGLTTQQIQLENVSALESIEAARSLGTDVIRDRADLMLFVIVLLLPVALVSPGGRPAGPAPRVVAALRRGGKLLGVFLVTSTIVAWVLGLTGIEPSPDLARSIVAVTVLVMAVYAVWRFTRREALVVGVVGALHGIGYADAYRSVQLDRVENPLTLIGFTLGTTLALLVLTLVVSPLLLVLRRVDAAPAPLYVLAGVAAAYSIAWLVEAATVIGLASNRYTTPLEVWPRNLVILLLTWVPAAAWLAWASGRDALRPVGGGHPRSEVDRTVVAS